MVLEVYIIFLIAFHVAYTAHPSGFLSVCILILSDCILRGALMCASFEMLCCEHPSRCLVVWCVRHICTGGLQSRVGLSWGFWRKMSPPCLRVFVPKDLFGGCFLRGKAPLEYLRLWLVSGLFLQEVICYCPRRCSLGWFLKKKRLPLPNESLPGGILWRRSVWYPDRWFVC